MQENSQLTQYEIASRKRTKVSLVMILICIPVTLLFVIALWGQKKYMLLSMIILAYTLVPFVLVFERRKPKAREIVMIAMMSALTVLCNLICQFTPLKAGSALVIIAGIALGPEAGFLVGALSRLICNIFQGQGPWTPWQMVCWGILGFLAGLIFNKVEVNRIKSKDFRIVLGPVVCIFVALIAGYVSYLLWPGADTSFWGWRLYAFGGAGFIIGGLLQHKRLPVDGITLTLYTFFSIFIIYGGIMNICAMVSASLIPGGAPADWTSLRILYLSGTPYDFGHALGASIFMFLFGEKMISKLERVKIKYGFYR